ncbi:MAG: pyruvate dehydrogenase complex dihydrolipoamide acetyltransferase [Paracoccaceae bacterium]|nr:pyruvate dehydrogenase complex dihydrolipoamide acetyltransferase [Paracoccaceae bacterium]MDE2916031.1 pyruvate dehydrogenase complex dihydrolipoamide acetyltransferase [Paracoccaceae bacterium]
MPTNILMPALSPTMEEGILSKWFVKEGDTVESGDLLAEIETDKATMEFESIYEGNVTQLLFAEGAAGIKVNTPIAVIDTGDSAVEESSAPADAKESKPEAKPVETSEPVKQAKPVHVNKSSSGRIFISPLAKRLARENGIAIESLKGSGHKGRIVKRDIEVYLLEQKKQPTPSAPTQVQGITPEAFSFDQVTKMYQDREYEVVELEGMRRTIATRLSQSKQTIPHYYLRREVELDSLLELRSKVNSILAKKDKKVSINDFIISAVAKALELVPQANTVWAAGNVLQLKSCDVAVAVSIDDGLITPVIKDANKKSLAEISNEMKDLAERARQRKLQPTEYIGGTITVSNLGMFGIENFDAIINPPHASILAVGTGKRKPVVGPSDEIEIKTLMSLTLSVDHRIIDGALGAQLLGTIVDLLENPVSVLLNLD